MSALVADFYSGYAEPAHERLPEAKRKPRKSWSTAAATYLLTGSSGLDLSVFLGRSTPGKLHFDSCNGLRDLESTKDPRTQARELSTRAVAEHALWGMNVPADAEKVMTQIITIGLHFTSATPHLSWDGEEFIGQWLRSPHSLAVFVDSEKNLRAEFHANGETRHLDGITAVVGVLTKEAGRFGHRSNDLWSSVGYGHSSYDLR